MLFVIMLALTACESKSGKLSENDDFLNSTPKEEVREQRMKLIDENHLGQRTFYIIEVDGHQYLSQYYGGFIHLESCPCKTK